MTLDNLTRKTVLRTARDFDDPTIPLVISNIRHCYVYILACISEITIKDCVDSTIVTGVSRMVTIENSSRCTIISVAKGIKIQSSSDSTLHMCVNTRPVLTVGNTNIILAPYNTFYSQLESQMEIKTGLQDNHWNSPMDYTRARSVSLLLAQKMQNSTKIEEKTHSYVLMNPEEFAPFLVPFQLPGSTKANPIPIPPTYTESMAKRAQAIRSLRGMVDQVPEPDRDELKKIIEDRFRAWLVQSGNIEQVNDLINFHLQ